MNVTHVMNVMNVMHVMNVTHVMNVANVTNAMNVTNATNVTNVMTVTQGPVLRKDKKFCSHLCGDPRKMTFLKFRESCQSDAVVFCIHCDK